MQEPDERPIVGSHARIRGCHETAERSEVSAVKSVSNGDQTMLVGGRGPVAGSAVGTGLGVATATAPLCSHFLSSGGGIRTRDVRVMTGA
jgi:hypothetical protein